MRLDMPFNEALERFIGTKSKEMHANIKRAKKKRPPGGKKAPSDDQAQEKSKNVTKLRSVRIRKRTGR
jgi:hypothetical protein